MRISPKNQVDSVKRKNNNGVKDVDNRRNKWPRERPNLSVFVDRSGGEAKTVGPLGFIAVKGGPRCRLGV
jgi:hypothetical protein